MGIGRSIHARKRPNRGKKGLRCATGFLAKVIRVPSVWPVALI